MAVGPDQHRKRSSDCPDDRQHPLACIGRLDQSHSIGPRRDVNPAGLTQVQQHRARVVQLGEDARAASGGLHVEVWHTPTEQWMSSADVVVNVEPTQHPGEVPARLVHAQQLTQLLPQRLVAIIGRRQCHLRHGVVQHPRTGRMPLGVIRVVQACG